MKLGVALSCSNWLADLTNAIWPLKRYYKNKVYIYLENNVVDIFLTVCYCLKLRKKTAKNELEFYFSVYVYICFCEIHPLTLM
jgi:hypothetical protein